MNSIQIRRFQSALQSYIAEQDFPAEVKRLILKEIYEQVSLEAAREIAQQQFEEKKPRKIFHEDPKPSEKTDE